MQNVDFNGLKEVLSYLVLLRLKEQNTPQVMKNLKLGFELVSVLRFLKQIKEQIELIT